MKSIIQFTVLFASRNHCYFPFHPFCCRKTHGQHKAYISKLIHTENSLFVELRLGPADVVPVDGDVIVAVGTLLLVLKSDDVTQLVQQHVLLQLKTCVCACVCVIEREVCVQYGVAQSDSSVHWLGTLCFCSELLCVTLFRIWVVNMSTTVHQRKENLQEGFIREGVKVGDETHIEAPVCQMEFLVVSRVVASTTKQETWPLKIVLNWCEDGKMKQWRTPCVATYVSMSLEKSEE